MITALACLELIILVVLAVINSKLSKENKKVVTINVARQKENESIEQQNQLLESQRKQLQEATNLEQQKLKNFKTSVQAQENVLKSLKESAKTQADREYNTLKAEMEARCIKRQSEIDAELVRKKQIVEQELNNYKSTIENKRKQADIEFESYQNEINRKKAEYSEEAKIKQIEIKNIQTELEDMKSKYQAYISEQRRRKEIEEKEDFYKLEIDSADVADIHALRQLQITFSRKEIIDKLIWENYIRSAFDALTARLNLPTGIKTCGVYKITNIKTGEVYIGQSVDIRERFRQHLKSGLEHTKASNKLYQSMQKYGVENFTFEILEFVPRERLNEREAYWIEFYGAKEYGMNSQKGNNT